MDIVELEEKIEQVMRKEDFSSEDESAKRNHLRKIIELMVRNRREEVRIEVYKKYKRHYIVFCSNGEIQIDGERYDINTVPIEKIEILTGSVMGDDIIVSTKRY